MSERTFKIGVIISALAFLGVFLFISLPAALSLDDTLLNNTLTAFAGGYVNPFATGYSVDATACWFILFFWVMYEAKYENIKNGWICLLVGAFPGIAIGFAAYLLVRHTQIKSRR